MTNELWKQMSMKMEYIPEVDDYVKWNGIEGWVYFKCEHYITIEFAVKDKPDNHASFHKKVHCCILCFPERWNELEYVKNRRDNVDVSQYKSQEHRYKDP